MIFVSQPQASEGLDHVVARRLRIQYEGAIYHVINRGRGGCDLFASVEAAKAFELALDETCIRYRWRLQAYAILRSQYHLAVETPAANLSEGMHWLQSALATRLNRWRSERGPLFEGRYRALLIEDFAMLARVVNHIHLQPLRAGIVSADQIAAFRWSSLGRFIRSGRPPWFAAGWLAPLKFDDCAEHWAGYLDSLAVLAAKSAADEGPEFSGFARGWAIGTDRWRKDLARHHGDARIGDIGAPTPPDNREACWADALRRILSESGKTTENIASDKKGAEWKCRAALRLKRETGASSRWIASSLKMGSHHSVRSYLSRLTVG